MFAFEAKCPCKIYGLRTASHSICRPSNLRHIINNNNNCFPYGRWQPRARGFNVVCTDGTQCYACSPTESANTTTESQSDRHVTAVWSTLGRPSSIEHLTTSRLNCSRAPTCWSSAYVHVVPDRCGHLVACLRHAAAALPGVKTSSILVNLEFDLARSANYIRYQAERWNKQQCTPSS